LTSNGDSSLDIPLRRLTSSAPTESPSPADQPHDHSRGRNRALLQDPLAIELLCRWIKQHLELRRSLGNKPQG
jgi:hypothetical protein